MTNEEKMAMLESPLTEQERAVIDDARLVLADFPRLTLAGYGLGRFPGEPHDVSVQFGHAEPTLVRFFDTNGLRATLTKLESEPTR